MTTSCGRTIRCALSVVVWQTFAMGVVGPTDPCPVPTPYPPPGVGAAVALNPDMEAGFTAGAANQWNAFKDPTYTGVVHFEGTDQFTNGSRSQKLVLPQPPINYVDQAAGLYQQIYVVPGGTYTAAARIRLRFPPQTYSGEDLVGYIGLDPYGEPSGKGFGSVWSTSVSSQNQWITATVTVKAVLPVMTLSLRAIRKWPQHGNGAEAWFDQVTLSGPVPTDPPPTQEPDPIDPETLIPATQGPNLVTNGSFEGDYVSGLAGGWNKWSTVGTGRWKQSRLAGKVGGGNYSWCGVVGDLEELMAMKSKTYLLQDRKGFADPLGRQPELEDSIIVGRIYIDNYIAQYLSNPTHYGRVHADNCRTLQLENPRIDCWQGLNEPDWGTDWWYQVLAFEKAFAERCHELGMKSCVLNLSTGSPGNIWRFLDAKDLLSVADYLGHHTYGGPADELMVASQVQDNPCAFSLRARRFKDMYARRGWRLPPVIYTESTTYGGWRGRFSSQQMINDLTLYGVYMNADRWCMGTTIFAVGGCGVWASWDIVGQGIATPVGQWNTTHPADAMEGLRSQMFGAGITHPLTQAEMTPAGLFNGGVNQVVGNLTAGREHLLICWMKYEFRGRPPTQLKFYLGVDPTGQTADGNAPTIDWGIDQIADKAPIHEIFSHVWRTFIPTSSTASIWLRASHPTADPSVMFYVDQVEVKSLVPPPGPAIALSTTQISVESAPGINPQNITFTVRNAGADTLDYSITGDANWLTVDPSVGTSAGEEDIVTVSFNVAGLPAGVHQAAITVTSPQATNSPQTITVRLNLTIVTVRPDFDQDGDVDQSDFGHLQACFTGSGFAQADPACFDARLDIDEDVDQDDFGIFQACISGPGVPVNLNCH